MHEAMERSTSQDGRRVDAPPHDGRRVYVTPRLTRHGTIRELTAALNAGTSDGVAGSISICSTFPC
jgi:hypothetical protein